MKKINLMLFKGILILPIQIYMREQTQIKKKRIKA